MKCFHGRNDEGHKTACGEYGHAQAANAALGECRGREGVITRLFLSHHEPSSCLLDCPQLKIA